MLDWKEVGRHFIRDGAWRDIVVVGSLGQDWGRFLEAVRRGPWRSAYSLAGMPAEIPGDAAVASADESQLLRIGVLRNGLNCHLWLEGEIELDFLPEDVSSIDDLKELGEFCFWLASLTGKPVRVIHEGDAESPIMEYHSDKSAYYLGKDPGYG